jgi:hypothetical protein
LDLLPTTSTSKAGEFLSALLARAPKTHFAKFTATNIAVSPLGMVVFFCFSAVLGWHPVLAFMPMSAVTTILSYRALRWKTYSGDHLHWRTNLHRWAWLKLGMFLLGLLIVGGLTAFGIPNLCAVIANGTAQWRPGYLLSNRWAFAEVKEAKA